MAMSIITIMVWIAIGLVGMVWDKEVDKTNYPMITFLAITPLLPWIFHWCGLF